MVNEGSEMSDDDMIDDHFDNDIDVNVSRMGTILKQKVKWTNPLQTG